MITFPQHAASDTNDIDTPYLAILKRAKRINITNKSFKLDTLSIPVVQNLVGKPDIDFSTRLTKYRAPLAKTEFRHFSSAHVPRGSLPFVRT